ncbi:MAG: AsmA-like C-terminal region-containing protein, partial [Planctomycetota bacterium]
MKRLRAVLEGLLFALCLLAVALALTLVIIDRSGLAEQLLLDRARAALGSDASRLQLGSLRLHWSDPGLRLRDVRLDDPNGDALLSVDSLRVRLGLFPPRVAAVELDGAQVTLSLQGLEMVDRWRRRSEADPAAPEADVDWRETAFPELRVANVTLLVDTTGIDEIQPVWRSTLCDLALSSTPRSDGTPWISGTLVPRPRPDRSLAPIRFVGSTTRDGSVAIQASSSDLDLDINALPDFLHDSVGLLGPWSALADVELQARFEGIDPIPVESDLRLRFDAFRAMETVNEVTPEDVEVIVQASFDRAAGSREKLLAIAAEATGQWRGSPFELDLRAGRAAPEEASITASGRIERLPLDQVTYDLVVQTLREDFGLSTTADVTESTISALGITGEAEARVHYERSLRRDGPQAFRHRVGVSAGPGRDATLSYQGWPTRNGSRIGFPVPIELLEGRVVVSVDTDAERTVQVGLSQLDGRHPSGTAAVDGVIATAPGGVGALVQRPDLRLSLHVPSMAVDTELRTGLEGLGLDFDVLEQFGPRGGAVAGRLELAQRPDEIWPVLSLDFDLDRPSMAWTKLPVPLDDITGTLALRFTRGLIEAPPDPADPEAGPRRRRPFGIAIDARGVEPGGAPVAVRVGLRDPELELLAGLERHPAGTHSLLRGVEIEAEGVPLGGETEAVLRAIDPVRITLDALSPEGSIDARVTSSVWARDRPRVLTVAVAPEELRVVSPFGVSASGMRGEAVVEEFESPEFQNRPEGSVSEADRASAREVAIRSRIAGEVEGTGGVWVEFDARPRRDAAEKRGGVLAVVAGLDPLFPQWGELALEFGSEEALDALTRLEQLAPEGRLDLVVGQPLNGDLQPIGMPSIQVHLRDNGVTLGTLEIDQLRGTIAASRSTVTVPQLSGRLAGEELDLSQVVFGPADQVGALNPEDAALLRRAAPGGGLDRILTARVDLDSFRIDADLISAATGRETTGDWQILLDADDAALLIALPNSGTPILATSGRFRPHDLRVTQNLRLSTADLQLRHAVLEGSNLRGLGRVEKGFGDVGGLEVANASATVSYVGSRLTLDGLHAEFAGGTLTGQEALADDGLPGGRAVSFEFVDPYRFDLALAVREVDVNTILSAVVQGDGTDAGQLRGHLRLVGEPKEPMSLEGSGFFALENARLYSIPVVRALFRQLGFDASATFDWMRTSIRVQDGELLMSDAVAHSPLVKLVGGGTLGLDGRLEHEFDLTYSLIDRFGPFGRLFYWFQSRFLRIAVRGDMTRP